MSVLSQPKTEFTQHLKGSHMTEKHIFLTPTNTLKFQSPMCLFILVSAALKNLNEAAKCYLSENST